MEMKSFNFEMTKMDGHKIYVSNFTYEYDIEEAIKTVYKLALGYLQDDQVQLRLLNRNLDIYEDYSFDSLSDSFEITHQELNYKWLYFSIWKNEEMLIEFKIRQY